MARGYFVNRAYGLFFVGDALLFVRNPETGIYSLPIAYGKKASKKVRDRLAADVPGLRFIGAFAMRRFRVDGLTYDSYPLVFTLDPDKVPQGEQYALLTERDERFAYVDGGSRAMAELAFIYAPLYLLQERATPLLPENRQYIYWQIQVIRHFRGRKIPKAEVAEFEALTRAASSVRRINAAFWTLCHTYNCNPGDYYRHLKFRAARREALK